MKRVFALVPAYNEEERIGKTLESLQKIVDSVIVVDDGSIDETTKVAESFGVKVIRNPINSGKGRALRLAIEELWKLDIKDDDIVLFIDADTQETASYAEVLLKKLEESGRGFYTVAVFPPPKKKGGFGFVKGISKNFIFNKFGVELKAPISGQRAVFFGDLEKAIKAFDYGFGLEVAFHYLMLKNNIKPVEVPVEMTHRETGRSIKDFMHRGKQFISILKVIADAKLGRL
jgi:glycosyltransferase involved in cell wall biosynthesis